MALFRLPLWLDKKIRFWKLMGCGKNGTFDKKPDWRQWAILQVRSTKLEVRSEDAGSVQNGFPVGLLPSFVVKYCNFFNCEIFTMALEPLAGHGLWDGKQVFGDLPKNNNHDGVVAVLTRATIRASKLKSFWRNVGPVAMEMKTAPGFIYSVGIGEVPLVKQATFSVWGCQERMQQFAYRMQQHRDVIHKTRKEHWYSEEMFIRFKITAVYGTLHGKNPIEASNA